MLEVVTLFLHALTVFQGNLPALMALVAVFALTIVGLALVVVLAAIRGRR